MEVFQSLISATLALFQIQFTLFGVTLSLWEVFLFSAFAGVVAWILGEVFLGD